MPDPRQATIYRMVLPDHECPFGLRARQMLDQAGFEVDEHLLRTREEVDGFKAEHGLQTTPLIVIGAERVGGSDDLERRLEA
jgi:glutaredoxin 3